MRVLLAFAVAALLLASGTSAGAGATPLRVLFVGNSLTSTNDLPGGVAALARAGGKDLEADSITAAGWSLEEHWNDGKVRAALATRSWDVVVLQQGPSALPESQVHLREWATRFAALARAVGTRTALLAVWPESYRRSSLATVVGSYRKAAEVAGADLYPAGAGWRAAWACDRRLALYGSDGFHPSRLGTHLAALVVYGRLFKAPVLSTRLAAKGVPERTNRLLQAAAATALGRRLTPSRRCGGG